MANPCTVLKSGACSHPSPNTGLEGVSTFLSGDCTCPEEKAHKLLRVISLILRNHPTEVVCNLGSRGATTTSICWGEAQDAAKGLSAGGCYGLEDPSTAP